jgi:hypothetical protein
VGRGEIRESEEREIGREEEIERGREVRGGVESGKRSWKIGQPYGCFLALTLTVHYSTLQCSAVQCSTERTFTVQYSTVQYSAPQNVRNRTFGAVQHCTECTVRVHRSAAQ